MIAGMLGERNDAFYGSLGGWVNSQQSVAELWLGFGIKGRDKSGVMKIFISCKKHVEPKKLSTKKNFLVVFKLEPL